MKQTQHYFSLIEFSVVVSILLILISLLLPSLKKVYQSSNSAVCRSNLKQISLVHHVYADDHDNMFIPIRNRTNDGFLDWRQIIDRLELYPIFDESALCPTRPLYGVNQTSHGGNKQVATGRPIMRDKLKDPSGKVQGGDATWSFIYDKRTDPEQSQGWLNYGEKAVRSFGYRHFEKANVFHFDGHVGVFDMYLYEKIKGRLRYSKDAFIKFQY